MSTLKKRHHLVPEFYLRRFTDKNGHIWNYDKEKSTVKKLTVINTSVEKHCYSYTDVDGTRNNDVEDFIAKIESDAAPVLEKFISGEKIEREQRIKLSSFFAITYARSNTHRRIYAELGAKLLQSLMYLNAKNEDTFETVIKKGAVPDN